MRWKPKRANPSHGHPKNTDALCCTGFLHAKILRVKTQVMGGDLDGREPTGPPNFPRLAFIGRAIANNNCFKCVNTHVDRREGSQNLSVSKQ
eukprot:1856468-Amphidinium_carterae.2